MARLQRQAGLNQFEFSMVLVLLGLIWLAALNRLHGLQEIGEKTAVEMTLRNIQSGLRWEMSERIITGREASIAELAGSNPVRWLEKPPDEYLGEFSAAPAGFSPGHWYFDTLHRELRYRPLLVRNLECRECVYIDDDVVLSWRIVHTGKGSSVRVVTVTPYRWF